MGLIKDVYKNFIGRRFVVKLFLWFALIIILAFLISLNLIINNISERLIGEEKGNQDRFLEVYGEFVVDELEQLNQKALVIYGDIDGKRTIIESLIAKENTSYVNLAVRGDQLLRSSLYALVQDEEEIKDVILLYEDNHLHSYTTSRVKSSLIREYDFSKDDLVKQFEAHGSKAELFVDVNPDYLFDSHDPVFTLIGNLYDVDNNLFGEPIGKYVINITTDVFNRAYDKYSNSDFGNVLLLDREGKILFSRHEEEIGTVYKWHNHVVNHTGDEIMLDELCIIGRTAIEPRGLTLISLMPKSEIVKDAVEIRNQIIWVVAVCLLFALVIALFLSSFFSKRLNRIEVSMQKVEEGDFSVRVEADSNDEIGHLSHLFNTMCERLDDYIGKVYIAEIERKNAEISTLQSKINPHFLYNTLELIRMKAVTYEAEEVSDMLGDLGRIFRWNIKGQKVVTVEEELEYTLMYLNLQKGREGRALDIVTNIERGCAICGIPKFLLQPIVENSIHHGLADKRTGTVQIDIWQEGSSLMIDVIDNGIGMSNERLAEVKLGLAAPIISQSDHIGISNVHHRIHLIFGMNYGLSIESSEGDYTKVTMKMPSMTNRDMNAYVQDDHR